MGKFAVVALSALGLLISTATAVPVTAAPAESVTGTWSVPFEEDPANQAYPVAAGPTEHCFQDPSAGQLTCKPTAVNSTVLPDGRILYWNGIESSENVNLNAVLQLGAVSRNSQARILDLRSGTPVITKPSPADGGAANPDLGSAGLLQPDPNGAPMWPLPGNNGFNNNPQASGDMFCSDQVALPDGRLIVAGGTAWYQEPQVPGTQLGVVELQGIRNTRLFDPTSNTFTQVGSMNYARWYPTLVEQSDGTVFVGGGTRKLIQTDGFNVEQTEIFNPATMKWTANAPSGSAAMPLMPRYHLLPNGNIYYPGVGQMFGPAGEAADEALYMLHQSWSPATDSWTSYGIGTFGARSGAFSVLMPLKAPYTKATVLTGGGTLGPPPGSYFPNSFTEISSFDASNNWAPTISQGPNLNNARWFSSSVTMPNDAVAIFSGGTHDEVVGPGTEGPVRMAEMYAPWDNQWHDLSPDNRDRTYHNTAVLLPDASILVGGHSPISLGYTFDNNMLKQLSAGTPFATANNFRDPSFEIYKPPYFYMGNRPTIDLVQSGIDYADRDSLNHNSFSVKTADAGNITSVRLIRLPALTHVTDANMRSVELPFSKIDANHIAVTPPPNGNIAPPGYYYLFINTGSGANTVPSTAAIVQVGMGNNMKPAAKPFGNLLSSTLGTATVVSSFALPNTGAASPAGGATTLIGASALLFAAAALVAALGVRRRPA